MPSNPRGLRDTMALQATPFGQAIRLGRPSQARGWLPGARHTRRDQRTLPRRRIRPRPQPPTMVKPVFDYPELDHVLNLTTRFLANLAMKCFLRRLAELYSTAERPKEPLVLHVALARSDEDAIPVPEDADSNMSYGCHGGVLPFVRGGLTVCASAARWIGSGGRSAGTRCWDGNRVTAFSWRGRYRENRPDCLF